MRPPPGADACCLFSRHCPSTDGGEGEGAGQGGKEEKLVLERGERERGTQLKF